LASRTLLRPVASCRRLLVGVCNVVECARIHACSPSFFRSPCPSGRSAGHCTKSAPALRRRIIEGVPGLRSRIWLWPTLARASAKATIASAVTSAIACSNHGNAQRFRTNRCSSSPSPIASFAYGAHCVAVPESGESAGGGSGGGGGRGGGRGERMPSTRELMGGGGGEGGDEDPPAKPHHAPSLHSASSIFPPL